MSQVKTMKDALETMYTTFKHSKSALARAVSNTTTSTRNLQLKINAFEESLNNLNVAHTSWVSKAELSTDDLAAQSFSNEWLEGRWVEADEVIDQANDVLHAAEVNLKEPVLQIQQKKLILEQEMKALQSSISNKIDVLSKETGGEIMSLASHPVYTGIVADVNKQLRDTYKSLSKSIMDCSGDKLEEVIENHGSFLADQEKRLLDVQMKLAKLTPSTAPTTTESPQTSASVVVPRTRSIEMEKSRVPMFSGKTIEYPEFKRGWMKVAASHWDEDNQVEQMKYKVDPHTKRILSRCKNMTDVWNALDHEYGQEMEVVNAVNAELRQLVSLPCSTEEFIIKLRNYLPGLEETLESVNGKEHLQTPDKVNLLVEKFDDRTQHDWEYFKSKNTGTTYDRFFLFILDRYDSCRSTMARINSREPQNPPPPPLANRVVNHTVTNPSCIKCNSWVVRGGHRTCPACGHTASEGDPIGHCLLHCVKYDAMTANQRSDCLENSQWCPIHLSSTHNFVSCTQKNDNRLVCGINGCQKRHHRSLHGSTTSFTANINSLHSKNRGTDHTTLEDTVLLSMQSISSASGEMNCFFDDGSNCCLILHSSATRLGLRGEDVVMKLTTVNGQSEAQSKVYSLNLIDTDNEVHNIKVFGVDWIAGAIEAVNIQGVKELFSSDVQGLWDKVATRPSGEIELLLGSNHLGLHPSDLEAKGNLKVLKSKFGSGYVLVGSHPDIKPLHSVRHTSHVNASVRATRLSFKSVRDYFDSNELQVEAPRRCNSCMNCKECVYQGHKMSLVEQFEYNVMKNNVVYDEVEKVYRVTYPFTEDPSILSNNFHQAAKIPEREEKKLVKENLLEEFNKEFDKMIAFGALVELSREEMNSWKGPVHWISLQHVRKPESPTTPLRIVSNSSLSDRNGNSVNSITMKGPNPMNDQREVVSTWRCYDEALSSDLTKAYFSMKTGELEMHIRRVVWRYGKTGENWRHFGYCTVSFGDKPAAVFLDLVIKEAASRFKHIDPLAAEKIAHDRYVDDIATGGSPEEVQRMAGSSVNDDDKFETNGTLSQILSHGSLKLKAIVTSGEEDVDKINKLGGYNLGIKWNPTIDVINIDARQTEALNVIINTTNVADVSLTPRILLGIINKPHDLLGLISPITIIAMAGYRDLYRLEPALGWDDEIPIKEKQKWVNILHILNEVSSVGFQRSTKPKSAVGNPEIIGYFDGSDNAYAAVVYIRWTLSDGSFDVNLACSKAKVTPLKRISTPRSEVSGAVLLIGLVLFFVKSCIAAGTTPQKVWLLGDSECTLASIEKTSGALGEYFGNRIGAILDNQARIQGICNVGDDGEWYHVSSSDNAADRPTRLDSTASDISSPSPWQKGPGYLYSPKEAWPIDRDFADRKESCIPECEILKRYRGLVHNIAVEAVPDVGVDNLIDPHFTNDWEKLIQRTLLYLSPFHRKRVVVDSATKFELAERVWFQYSMKDTRLASEEGKLKSLFIEERDGLIVVVGRAQKGLQKLFGKDSLPVLMRKSRIAFLIMLWAHNQNHDARDITMSIACSKAWIVGAKRLATSITVNCLRCRFLHKIKVQQKMSVLPPSVQVPCPPFSNVGVDLCGPLIVHAMTNKRATLKVWNVIFVCLNTKAVTMHLAPGYSTEDFLIAYDSHVYDRGTPTTVHSDKGSQLVAAGKEVDFDWDAISRRTSKRGTKWDFTPAGAQWRNGAVEIFVKKFKKSFDILYGKTRLNFAEMACALKRISSVLNDRPLSVQKSTKQYPDVDFLTPITPNMILTGRADRRPPVEYDINTDELPEDRLSYVEELERAWWYQYKVQYFASLVPTQKWLKAERNMRVDDIVLIEYKNKSFPGTYRLGRVKDVEIDSNDGLVRNCTVVYKLVKPSSKNPRNIFKDITTKEVRVPVQRLVLIIPFEEQ